MTTRTAMIAAAVLLTSFTAAQAGSNTCEGTVTVGKEWTTIKGDLGDHAPEGCRFQTSSKLGRRIIAACPEGSECQIDIPLNNRSSTVTSITHVEARSTKQPQSRVVNEAVVRKLCPDPTARCMARDNPEFYQDTDPAFYNRITKPAGR